jgi:nucleotide-binding universal stress UspA family protein
MQILAATDFSTRSQRALRRAGLLARERGAELALVHVVDDDQPPDLVALETREAERTLGEQISAMAELRGVRCRSLVVAGDPFDGILRTAASTGADVVVMGAHRKQLLRDIFVGTTIERVIRRAIRKFGVRGQAAACSSAVCTGSPSQNWTPRITWASRSEPSNRRQLRSADLASL